MPNLPPILISTTTGFISGLLLAIPVGPVNLTIMNEGARRGFKYAALISAGALTMEFIYCSLAFTSLANFLSQDHIKAVMEWGSFLFMLGLGIWFLMAKSARTPSKMEERIEEKLHPHSAFMTGMVRVLGNLGVPASWVFFGIYFKSHDWVQPTLASKGACVLGVTMGTGAWFFGLAYAVSLGHRKFSDQTLRRMERGSGIGLLALAIAHGIHILWRMHPANHLYP
jgi:threonine/homoserine/homoserine lactone efflux protein